MSRDSVKFALMVVGIFVTVIGGGMGFIACGDAPNPCASDFAQSVHNIGLMIAYVGVPMMIVGFVIPFKK